MIKQYRVLRLVLGDQLNESHSWLRQTADDVLYVLMETRSETDYTRHHIQKVTGFFLAMRLFADRLRELGHEVHYFTLDDPENTHQFAGNCALLAQRHGCTSMEYQEPDEWRVDMDLKQLAQHAPIPVQCVSTEHFYTDRDTLQKMFPGNKKYLMEHFYRKMRQSHRVLMDEDGKTPYSGRWNYDAENRNKLPSNQPIPPAPVFFRDVHALVAMIQQAGVVTMGTVLPERFNWPVTRAESLDLLEHFIQIRLRFFGKYQDALTSRDWVLFHSRLSFSLNIKLISPREVVQRCLEIFYQKGPEFIALADLEGFIRQILGWREFVRGVYWAEMPHYAALNVLEHTAPLPQWFWTGDTKMQCLRHTIKQSLERAYAHHIQRLMVTGNFSLLLGVHPDEVDAWYLGIYMDAVEWVEMPNTRGMSQYADGGIVGTKPYVSSANYIHKMSDYCTSCHYNKSERYGAKACPFNALYWSFYHRHADRFRNNPRVGQVYSIWNKMAPDEQQSILKHGQWVQKNIHQL